MTTTHTVVFSLMRTKACMGGWCALREHCPHFHATLRRAPSERLCTPGRDGHSDVVALEITLRRPPADNNLIASAAPAMELA